MTFHQFFDNVHSSMLANWAMVSITHFTLLAAMLFSLGLIGVLLNRKNIITLLMSIELMLLAVNINFVAFSHQWQNLTGQVFVLFVLTVAAAEVAIGLAIVVVFYRLRAHIRIDSVNDLKN